MASEDSPVSGVAGRYATALFELARDDKNVDAVKADLDRFDALIAESPDLALAIVATGYGSTQRVFITRSDRHWNCMHDRLVAPKIASRGAHFSRVKVRPCGHSLHTARSIADKGDRIQRAKWFLTTN